jgi:hypothetical protein
VNKVPHYDIGGIAPVIVPFHSISPSRWSIPECHWRGEEGDQRRHQLPDVDEGGDREEMEEVVESVAEACPKMRHCQQRGDGEVCDVQADFHWHIFHDVVSVSPEGLLCHVQAEHQLQGHFLEHVQVGERKICDSPQDDFVQRVHHWKMRERAVWHGEVAVKRHVQRREPESWHDIGVGCHDVSLSHFHGVGQHLMWWRCCAHDDDEPAWQHGRETVVEKCLYWKT